MKIRRFFAPDMRQAIRMVREGQGPDAVILSSRRVEGGIEIVSAMDYDPDLVTEMAQEPKDSAVSWNDDKDNASDRLESLLETPTPIPSYAKPESPPTVPTPVADPDDEPDHEPPLPHTYTYARPLASAPPPAAKPRNKEVVWSQDPTLVAMQREIENLRGMLQNQLASLAWNDLRLREPDRAGLIHRLEHLGLEPTLARDIANDIQHIDSPEYAWNEALQLLAQRIPVAPEAHLTGEGVIALVGPSGVGKTTSVVKLAARHMQRHGQHSLALVTTDTYRIGAYRQLQTFGQLLGVPVYLAQTGKELGDILLGLEGKSRVFVDTAGMSQRDLSLAEEMAGLAAIPSLRTLLVVAANTQQMVLQETFKAFAHLPLAGLVLTKVDEAASLGPVLSALNSSDLPMMYVSEGPRVSDDLQPARLQRLINHAVALSETTNREAEGASDSRPAHDNLSRNASVSA